MLSSLQIENVAVIQKAEVHFTHSIRCRLLFWTVWNEPGTSGLTR